MAENHQRRPDIRSQQVGDDLMLLDDASDTVHVLNGSATFIWNCLSSPTTIAGVEEQLRAEYDVSAMEDLPGLIRRTVSEFQEKGLLAADTVSEAQADNKEEK